MTEPRVEAGDRALETARKIHAKNCGSVTHDHPQNGCAGEISANAALIQSAMNAQQRELDQLLPDSLNRPMGERIQGLKERADREAKLAVNLSYGLQKLVDRLNVVMSWPDKHFANDLPIEIGVEMGIAERLLAERGALKER